MSISGNSPTKINKKGFKVNNTSLSISTKSLNLNSEEVRKKKISIQSPRK